VSTAMVVCRWIGKYIMIMHDELRTTQTLQSITFTVCTICFHIYSYVSHYFHNKQIIFLASISRSVFVKQTHSLARERNWIFKYYLDVQNISPLLITRNTASVV
jgi:hypothetical protein